MKIATITTDIMYWNSREQTNVANWETLVKQKKFSYWYIWGHQLKQKENHYCYNWENIKKHTLTTVREKIEVTKGERKDGGRYNSGPTCAHRGGWQGGASDRGTGGARVITKGPKKQRLRKGGRSGGARNRGEEGKACHGGGGTKRGRSRPGHGR